MAKRKPKTELAVKEAVKELELKQEKFCQLYATDREFFGNGVQTYIEVYNPDRTRPNWYKTAKTQASRLLSNVNLCNRINELLEQEGLNNEFVDKQTLFLITQHSDFGSKIRAIQEYNKLKKRIGEVPPALTQINIQINKNTLNILNNAEKQLEEEMRKGIEENGTPNSN